MTGNTDVAGTSSDQLLQLLRDRDVACPKCGYNLRNLSVSRCPECGSQLTIEALLARPPRALRPPLLLTLAAALPVIESIWKWTSLFRFGADRYGDMFDRTTWISRWISNAYWLSAPMALLGVFLFAGWFQRLPKRWQWVLAIAWTSLALFQQRRHLAGFYY